MSFIDCAIQPFKKVKRSNHLFQKSLSFLGRRKTVEKVIQSMDDSVGTKIGNRIFKISFQVGDLTMLRFRNVVNSNMNALTKLRYLYSDLFPDKKVFAVRIL